MVLCILVVIIIPGVMEKLFYTFTQDTDLMEKTFQSVVQV